jgi:hypothetical protein
LLLLLLFVSRNTPVNRLLSTLRPFPSMQAMVYLHKIAAAAAVCIPQHTR